MLLRRRLALLLPLLGKLLAEKTLGMAPSHDIAPFSAARECVQWPKVKAMA